jgi:hypothetical protein
VAINAWASIRNTRGPGGGADGGIAVDLDVGVAVAGRIEAGVIVGISVGVWMAAKLGAGVDIDAVVGGGVDVVSVWTQATSSNALEAKMEIRSRSVCTTPSIKALPGR